MTTCIAVFGPAAGQVEELTVALQRVLSDRAVRQAIYLGKDQAAGESVDTLLQASMRPADFFQKAAEVALQPGAGAIDQLLTTEARSRRLAVVRCLPTPPKRAIEMLERWILLAIHDKAVLDEDDIANAHVILYGNAQRPAFKRFGRRLFFTPGPLDAGHMGRLELQSDGDLRIQLCDLSGNVLEEERLTAGSSKLVVTT